MTDDEAKEAVAAALASEGEEVTGLLVSSLRGAGGVEVVCPDHEGGSGASFYVQDDSREVFHMPSSASSAPAFEQVFSLDDRQQWKVGADGS